MKNQKEQETREKWGTKRERGNRESKQEKGNEATEKRKLGTTRERISWKKGFSQKKGKRKQELREMRGS